MHSLLEEYLKNVAARLGPLPEKRRTDELREMRAHLENAVLAYQDTGKTEAEVAQAVLEQFGPPDEIAYNLTWAWRREERKREKRSSWIKAVIAAALCLLGCFQYPHNAGLFVSGGVFYLLLLGWQQLPPKYVPGWLAFKFGPMSLTQRWPYACMALSLFMFLHPFYVPSLLWTHTMTRILNIALGLAVFYMRYREEQGSRTTMPG